MKKIIKIYKTNEMKIRLVFLILSGAGLLASLILGQTGNDGAASAALSAVAIIFCGVPIVAGAIIGVARDRDITADMLVSLALIGSLILNEWFAAGEVAFIMQVGSMLEDITSARAKKGIRKLIKITPKQATVVLYGNDVVIDSADVKIGDILRVKAGESVPVDGVITEGYTSIDQSAMTGESIPLEKKEGDIVMSGTINKSGAFLMRAEKKAEDSALQRMVKLAEEADAQKAHIVRRANKWAAWLVIVSLSVAVIAGVTIGIANGDFRLGFERAVTVLVVFCPCAFVLATPTAISAGIGNAARHGVIIQSGEALERIASSDIAVFDKTGTLTVGKPTVKKVISYSSISEEEVLRIAASGEKLSNHPLAQAIVEYNKNPLFEVTNHQTTAGFGIEFEIENNEYTVGKATDATLAERGVSNDASTTVAVMSGTRLLGLIFIEDSVKENARDTVRELHALGKKVILLTGDNEMTAKAAAALAEADEYMANCSPEDKMNYIKSRESEGHKAAMFGDGINDALALRSAYAGIAMGGIGSDVAVESADAVIVHDNLDVIPYLFRISKKTKRRININLCVSMALNILAVALSIAGILDTVWGALFHNCGSVAVVISAFLLLFSNDGGDRSKRTRM